MGSKHGAVSNIGWCVRIWNHMRCTVQFTCRFMYDLVHMQVYRVDKAVAHALSDGDVDVLIHERLFVRCAGGVRVVLVLSSSGPVTNSKDRIEIKVQASRSHMFSDFGATACASPTMQGNMNERNKTTRADQQEDSSPMSPMCEMGKCDHRSRDFMSHVIAHMSHDTSGRGVGPWRLHLDLGVLECDFLQHKT